MASSPQTPLIPATVTPTIPTTVTPLTITPASKILGVSTAPLTDDSYEESVIWKRIRDANVDEESIRRRDKASLIAYIAKLEARIDGLQHDMRLLILESKDSASKYEDAILSAEKAKVKHLREQAGLSSTLVEARKREDNLKKSLGIEKECVANIEKALHEMRAECAEVKITAESKMAEASSLVEDTQQKYVEAEVKLRAAESLRDEARRSERAAGRKLQEVEAREDDIRRRMTSFKSNCDAKENELMLERQSLAERQRVLSESQNKLLDSQALLNQREADILSKSQALKRLERELTDKKERIAAEMRALADRKSDLELNANSLSEREKVVVEKEVSLNLKERELLVSQEMLASKEHNKIHKIIAEQEMALKRWRDEFDIELQEKQRLFEEDIEKKRRAWELKELDLKQKDIILEKEQDLEVQSRVIADKGKDLAVKMKNMQEREYHLGRSQNEVELLKSLLQKEREEIGKVKVDLENSLISLEEEKKYISEEKMRLELVKSETSELFVLETKLKEEIDLIRAQKQQLDSEAEKLKVEKSKFETEWELIDVKREELQREAEQIAVERVVISNSLKDERDNLNLEKEALREQYKRDLQSLTNDREALMSENQIERSNWFSKFQKEREDLLLEIECRKREMEDCVNKRREDIESYLREKERTFEEEKKRDLQYICSRKEDLIKEQERVAVALKKFETEKLEIKVDREQRDRTWAEMQNLIEELQLQRLKLKEQREMLRADREEILCQVKQLKKSKDVKADAHIQQTYVESSTQVLIQAPQVEQTHKHASMIFKHPSKEVEHIESSLDSSYGYAKIGSVGKESLKINEKFETPLEILMVGPPIENAGQPGGIGSEEPKVIREVPSIDKETSLLEARKDVHESLVPSLMTLGASKRRIDSSDADIQNDDKLNKKRRQERGDAHEGRY
ncbi:hypothetical protein RND81_13G170300 [Saponaria officinalis]|uniref:Uncharacterized protein n=1 Tax=Saponaria officinalis TaxID=3572 RepID=A0AAW1H3J0_SAPOF